MARTKKEPRKKMRKFVVHFEADVEIEVDDALLKSCNTDEWRESMMHYTTDEQFVEHIAYNMVVNNLPLHSIDGYADQPEERVALQERAPEWEMDVSEVER